MGYRHDQGAALLKHRVSRRAMIGGGAKVALTSAVAVGVVSSIGRAAMADSTAGAMHPALASAGLPELKIGISDTAYEGVPAETAAGWYLVTFTNKTQSVGAATFLQLPDGVTMEDLPGPPPDSATSGSDAAGAEGDNGAPDWLYRAVISGGAMVGPGQTLQAVIELRPGKYAVLGEDPTAGKPPKAMKVTGEKAAAAPAIQPDVTVNEIHTDAGFAFQIDGKFKSGPQLVKIVNLTTQPHFLELGTIPDGTTKDQVMQALTRPEGEKPAPGELSQDDYHSVAFAGTQSTGTTQYQVINLEPATYMLACFINDPAKDGMPHAMEGMLEILTVAD